MRHIEWHNKQHVTALSTYRTHNPQISCLTEALLLNFTASGLEFYTLHVSAKCLCNSPCKDVRMITRVSRSHWTETLTLTNNVFFVGIVRSVFFHWLNVLQWLVHWYLSVPVPNRQGCKQLPGEHAHFLPFSGLMHVRKYSKYKCQQPTNQKPTLTVYSLFATHNIIRLC